MSKYKVGDKVVVKKELKKDKKYYMENSESCWYEIDEEMKEYESQVVTINYVCEKFYEIEEDYGDWVWTDEMFEGLDERVNKEEKQEEPKYDQITVENIPSNIIHKSNLRTGDIVITKNGNKYIVLLNTSDVDAIYGISEGIKDEYEKLSSYNDYLVNTKYDYLTIVDILKPSNSAQIDILVNSISEGYKSILPPTKKMTLEEMIAEVEKLHGCKVEIVDNK